MNDKTPFVIQFSSLDHFCEEVRRQGLDIVRVWSGGWSENGQYGGVAYRVVNAQAIDPSQGAVLSISIHLGAYQQLYGKPFREKDERATELIEQYAGEVQALVESYINENAGVVIRPGMIYTGLTGKDVQRATWNGLVHIYKALELAKED